MKENNIYDGLKTLQSGNSIYVARKDSEIFIWQCDTQNIGILGFDGIYCGEGYARPDPGLIADFSEFFKESKTWKIFQKESCQSALAIIKDFPDDTDLYIDFVLEKNLYYKSIHHGLQKH